MENIASYNVARKYEKRALLILVNLVAGLSIFFFGYDQGVMGGVRIFEIHVSSFEPHVESRDMSRERLLFRRVLKLATPPQTSKTDSEIIIRSTATATMPTSWALASLMRQQG